MWAHMCVCAHVHVCKHACACIWMEQWCFKMAISIWGLLKRKPHYYRGNFKIRISSHMKNSEGFGSSTSVGVPGAPEQCIFYFCFLIPCLASKCVGGNNLLNLTLSAWEFAWLPGLSPGLQGKVSDREQARQRRVLTFASSRVTVFTLFIEALPVTLQLYPAG